MNRLQLCQFALAALFSAGAQAQGVAAMSTPNAPAAGASAPDPGTPTGVCPFTLGPICFQPAVGAINAKRANSADYRDLRFAAVLHKKELTTHSWGVMVAPGEKFIDALGIGGASKLFDINGGRAILNYGLLAKRYTDSEPIRGGVYLMLSVQMEAPEKSSQ
jgi:hypothetical protein